MAEISTYFSLEFRCTSNETDSERILTTRTLKFSSSSSPTTVADLTRKIEETMEIPQSLVKLELNSAILDVRMSLDELRVRTGDTFIVHYYSIADCRVINECIAWMRELLLHLRKWKENSCSHLDPNQIKDTNYLQMLGIDLFSPWLDPKSYANKLYFISKDGLALVSEAMSILLEVPLASIPTTLQRFEMEILLMLWNITEDTPTRKAVVQSDGIEICKRALLRIPIRPHSFVYGGFFGKEIIRMSLGVFANICELPEIRLKIASDKELIKQMLSVMLCPSYGDNVADRVVMILLVLSYSFETHSQLISHNEFAETIKNGTATQFVSNEVQDLLRYHKMVLYSIFLLSSPHCLSEKDKDLMQTKLENFIQVANYQELSYYESIHLIVWDTILPHMKLLYKPERSDLNSNLIGFCKQTVILTLLTMLVTENHRNVMIREGLVDYIVCLPWFTCGEVQKRAKELVSIIREVPDVLYEPPSLLNMTKGAVSIYFCGLEDVMKLSVPELARELYY